MTYRCAICRRRRLVQDKRALEMAKASGFRVDGDHWRCPYGGPFVYQRVAADGLTFIGPVERLP